MHARNDAALALFGPAHASARGAYDRYLAPTSACPGSDAPSVLTASQELQMLCLIDYVRAADAWAS